MQCDGWDCLFKRQGAENWRGRKRKCRTNEDWPAVGGSRLAANQPSLVPASRHGRHLEPSRSVSCLPLHSSPMPPWARVLKTTTVRSLGRRGQLLLVPFRYYSSKDALPQIDYAAAREWFRSFNPEVSFRNVGDLTYSRSSGPGGQNVNKYCQCAIQDDPTSYPFIPGSTPKRSYAFQSIACCLYSLLSCTKVFFPLATMPKTRLVLSSKRMRVENSKPTKMPASASSVS